MNLQYGDFDSCDILDTQSGNFTKMTHLIDVLDTVYMF